MPQTIGGAGTEDLSPQPTIIGQERAVKALQFGLDIKMRGFNVYVAGLPGTGKTTAVRTFLENLAGSRPVPPDFCYVHNFAEPHRPRAIRLPAGEGAVLAREMRDLVETARKEISRVFESEEYARRKAETLESFAAQKNEVVERVNRRAAEEGFFLQSTPMGFFIIPAVDGQPMKEKEFLALPAEVRQGITARREKLEEDIEQAVRQMHNLDHQAAEAVQQLERETARFAVGHLVERLRDGYADHPAVLAYLDEVEQDIVENIPLFRGGERQQGMPPWVAAQPFRRYEVNVLVSHAGRKGAPVVIEVNPTMPNLVGRVEREAQFGALVTDFSMIRAGALHRANGGYLVIPVEELLRNPFSWDALKRALRDEEIVIEEPGERLGFMLTKGLQPVPIPLDIKVVLLGDPFIYFLLYNYDPDFRELFKVKAEFDTRMPRDPDSERKYVSFCAALCAKEDLRPPDEGAVARIIEYGSRLAEDQARLSTRFADLADVVREASYYASRENAERIAAEHVERAITERLGRSSLVRERIQEAMERHFLLIDTAGSVVGQVNGLAVSHLGDLSFGRPCRITASVAPGSGSLIDIEREARLGGRLHTKGVMILGGYLAAAYGRLGPLSLTARLVFEQSYEEVDGDSASSAELYALLSALADVPLRQDIAVTGSINQRGDVQAIGGVNEKVEGFFDLCAARGLTGTQGVLIPKTNIANLMLKDEVVEAVRAGRFHVWAVDRVEDGLQILTGMPAGTPDEEGRFPEGTVGFKVAERLAAMAEKVRPPQAGGTGETGGDGGESCPGCGASHLPA
ncbi:MAG: ATP-binding protein [Bacillota bacterium]|nr:ATP-binding protein [Bacillota bacterium]